MADPGEEMNLNLSPSPPHSFPLSLSLQLNPSFHSHSFCSGEFRRTPAFSDMKMLGSVGYWAKDLRDTGTI
jgi:hypothetical protein